MSKPDSENPNDAPETTAGSQSGAINIKENLKLESKSPSKLFALKDEVLRWDGFWSSEEEIANAFNTFANEDVASLAQDMYELMFKYQETIERERIDAIQPDFPRSHVEQNYGTSEQIWQRMHDLISVMILKIEHGEL